MTDFDGGSQREAVLNGVGSGLRTPSKSKEEEYSTATEDGGGDGEDGGGVVAHNLSSAFKNDRGMLEEAPVESLQDVLKNGGTGGAAAAAEAASLASPATRRGPPPSPTVAEDDPETREPMHPAVGKALHAYCLTMTHPYKGIKMDELALECVTILVSNHYVSGRAGRRHEAVVRQEGGGKAGGVGISEESKPTMSLLQYIIESVARCSESNSDVVQSAMAKALLALIISPKCGVHEAPMLMAVRASFHVYLVSKSATAREVSKATLLDMLRSVFNRMEAYDAMLTGAGSGRGGGGKGPQSAEEDGGNGRAAAAATNGNGQQQQQQQLSAFASQFHTDGYLLFRALCKLSAKTLPEESTAPTTGASSRILQPFTSAPPTDPLALNSKILSMELILAVFEHCGEAFRTGDKFIYAVQNYLCVSLLKNCMSNHTQVAYLSLKIFLLLVSLGESLVHCKVMC